MRDLSQGNLSKKEDQEKYRFRREQMEENVRVPYGKYALSMRIEKIPQRKNDD